MCKDSNDTSGLDRACVAWLESVIIPLAKEIEKLLIEIDDGEPVRIG